MQGGRNVTSDEVYDLLSEARRVKDIGTRIWLLDNQDSDLKKYLRYTYAPSLQYRRYIVKGVVKAVGQGSNTIDASGFLLLRAVSNRSLSGQTSISVLKTYVRNLSYKSGEMFKCMLLKDLRIWEKV